MSKQFVASIGEENLETLKGIQSKYGLKSLALAFSVMATVAKENSTSTDPETEEEIDNFQLAVDKVQSVLTGDKTDRKKRKLAIQMYHVMDDIGDEDAIREHRDNTRKTFPDIIAEYEAQLAKKAQAEAEESEEAAEVEG